MAASQALVGTSSGLQINRQDSVRKWYFDPATAGCDILKDTFKNAKLQLERELSPQECSQIFGSVTRSGTQSGGNDISAFTQTVQQAQSTYAQKKSSGNKSIQEAHIWLNAVSTRIVYYGDIMDVLVQHHPEYVALAWGTFKFLFTAIINHQELLAKISKHTAQVADLLPQQKMALILYPTAEMQQAVAWVYASIMKFLYLSICFYKEGKVKHSIKAIFQPWALRFQDLYDELSDRSMRVKELASTAAKAELRDVHLDILDSRKVSDEMNSRIKTLHSTIEGLTALFEQKMSHQTDLFSTMYQEVRLDLSQQKYTIDQIHLNQLLSMSFWQQFPSSGECLEYCLSMRRRRTHYSRLDLPQESQLQRWAEEPKTSLLAVEGHRPIMQKDFMTDIAGLIRRSDLPAVWAFRFPDYWDLDLTVTDIVRMLVLQALQNNPGPLTTGANPLTLSHMREAASVRDWVQILARVLSHTPRVFILLDGDLLSQAAKSDRREAATLVELLGTTMTTSVKIMFPVLGIDADFMQKLREDCDSLELISYARKGRQKRRQMPRDLVHTKKRFR